jgi:micrococcal nuclease
MYTYSLEVTSVYDGDTITGNIDLGFNIKKEKVKLRLARIDTPEIRTKDLDEKERGYAARDYLRELLEQYPVFVTTTKKGKYGRWICELYIGNENISENVNDMLVKNGHAVYKEY